MPCKTTLTIELTDDEKRELESRIRSTTMRAGLVRRSRVVLLREEGLPVTHIAARVGMQRRHVEKWLKRFRAEGLSGLSDKPGRGRKPAFSPTGRGAHGQNCMRTA